MDLFKSNKTQNKPNEVAEAHEKKLSTKLTEFLSTKELEDWPLPESFENPIDYKSDELLAASQDEIAAIFDEAAPLRLHMLDEMEERLSDMEAKLNLHANHIVTDGKRQSCHVNHTFRTFRLPAFITEILESDALKSHNSSEEHKSLILAEMLLEMKKKTLDYFKFPGFIHGEFIELPSKLEALPILHHVSTLQNFNPGFKTFWKKIFLSEASSAVLQDSFWWIFLDKFNKEACFQDDKDLLFDRIADSYAALFMSINTDVKDKFLSVYPACLSQALYCTYKEAFPESKWRFDEEFKHYLVNLIHEWITGIHPVFGTWKTWNEENLKRAKTSTQSESTIKVLEGAAVHMKMELNLDVDACIKVIDKLGTNDCDLTQTNISQENTATPGAKSAEIESHQIGPGPECERVKFNLSGRSPLIAHYLDMLQLRNDIQPGIKVRRTEIMKLPPESQTYQQFITSTLETSESLKTDYTRICEQTSADILDLKRWQRDTNKELNMLKKALTNSRNAQERSLAIDAIMEYKESGFKGIPMIENQSPNAASGSSSSCDEEEIE